MLKYADIHTHVVRETDSVQIFNTSNFNPPLPDVPFVSAGIHPCCLQEDTAESQWQQLLSFVRLNKVVAIGECGLDKNCDTPFMLQQTFFERQIQMANQLQKPLIIHCVRAFNEVVDILKYKQVSVPVIFHGFNRNIRLAQMLIKEGYFLSFGKSLLNTASANVWIQTPLERIFLETDGKDIDLKDLYHQGANLKGIAVSTLQEQINNNIQHVFKMDF